MPDEGRSTVNTLEPYFMPFTNNRQFKSAPRILVAAEGVHYTTEDGRRLLDGSSGMWCVNAGHGRDKIVRAIQEQAAAMDYAPAFQCGHPGAFDLAARLATLMPGDLDHAFFCNSGSEAVDTALKIALAYHRQNGEATRTRLIGRERGYHGGRFRRHRSGRDVQQPQAVRQPGVGRRPPAAYPRSGEDGVLPGPARMGGPSGGRSRRHLRAARPVDDRRGDRRAGGGLDRRAGSAGGLPRAAARDLRPPRNPADPRRGDHRVRTPGRGVRGRAVRDRARHDYHGQGADQRDGADVGGGG